MPLILEPDTWDLWMTGEPDAAAVLVKPANEDVLVSRPVSKLVNNVRNNEQHAGTTGSRLTVSVPKDQPPTILQQSFTSRP
jgi:putative SOS response-associated peptidase YedK